MSQYKNIKQEFNEAYYDTADEFSENVFDNPGFVRIFESVQQCHSVLEVGCGTGTKIAQLTTKQQDAHGCDINAYAIERAKKNHPHIDFFVQDSLQLHVPKNTYDAVMTFFVLEHVQESEAFVNELLRVTKPGGMVAIMCPNYGSPFFPSPPSKYGLSAFGKMRMYLRRFVRTIHYHVSSPSPESLHFTAVTPITSEYKTDYDTVVEPYVYDLKSFIEQKGHRIEYASSLWSVQTIRSVRDMFYLPLKLIGLFGLGAYWGPQVCIIIRKSDDTHAAAQ